MAWGLRKQNIGYLHKFGCLVHRQKRGRVIPTGRNMPEEAGDGVQRVLCELGGAQRNVTTDDGKTKQTPFLVQEQKTCFLRPTCSVVVWGS